MSTTLKIMAWNSNGLLKHQNELQAVLETENIDVCLISETHFTNQSFIKFRGYKVYNSLHPDNSARGGSAVIIKESINHYEQSKFQEPDIQAVAVSVKTKFCHLSIAAVYCPPRHMIRKERFLNLFEVLGQRFILGGDFNAKHTSWGSRLTTTKGRHLLNAVKDSHCAVMSTGKPTYWPTDHQKIPDLIDFFICKNISTNYVHLEEGFNMNSDHSPIILRFSQKILLRESHLTLVNKSTDWDSFALDLDNIIDLKTPLHNQDQLDSEVNKYFVNIQQCAWNNTPQLKRKYKGHLYPKEIVYLLTEKRKQRKRWQQTRCPRDKTLLNNLTKRLKRKIKQNEDERLNTYLVQLTNDESTDFSLWKATRKLKRPIVQIPPIRNSDGKWAITNEQKAFRFAQYLEDTFQPNESSIEILETENLSQSQRIRLVTPKEVLREIQNNISSKKSPGYDLITGEILKHLPRKAIVKLTRLINAAFILKHVPKPWKVAEVIMIAKPGKPPHEASSYRPISLLPVLSKLFEKLLLKRLKPIIEEKDLIPNHQFGFREKHSTIDQVHRITNIIEKSLENKQVCATVFLDVAQAFDKVWHEGLVFKLRRMLPPEFADILESYLSDRMFRIRQEDAYSQLKTIKAGVPQGSVLGPILYLLYTCDIPELENNTIATFADDTAIMATGSSHKEAVEKVQQAVNKVYDWTQKWKIKLNESKSIHIDFTNKHCNYHPIYINGMQVPYANTAKYLGITLDAKLRWKSHVKKKRQELDIRYKSMYWLFGRKSCLSVQNKIILYKHILMPIWTYGIQLWGCTKQSNVKIIQQFQNKVLRDAVNAPWYIRNDDLHRDLKIELVTTIIKKFAEAHEHRLHRHVNIEAIQLLDNTNIVRRLKRTKPFELV